MALKNITLTGAEITVTGLDGSNAAIRNDGAEVIYAAKQAGITPGADGVLSIPAGGSAVLYSISGAVYASGTGAATIISSDFNDNPFKTSAQGGSGADEVARAAIKNHTDNLTIHVTADDMKNWNGNANLALQAAFPRNKLIYDDKDKPSAMVYVPKFKMSDVIEGASSNIHPAFIVNGVERDGFYVSKFQNVAYAARAYSLPGEDPGANINADTSRSYCESKGNGWHLMTAAEWGALALWCKKNGWLPWGNNNCGKDARETMYKAIPTLKEANGAIDRVATGTGPVEWSHNKQLDGIYDLNGNVWEWVDGMRLVSGELQILEDNNAADSGNLKTAASAAWKAINGVTGELIVPDGNGTTANSIKLDFVSNAWKWITGEISSKSDSPRNAAWASTTADTTICDAAKELLYALALMPDSTTFDYEGDIFYANNDAAERFPYRGGRWDVGAGGGVFSLNLSVPRSGVHAGIGFRSAFIE